MTEAEALRRLDEAVKADPSKADRVAATKAIEDDDERRARLELLVGALDE